MVVSKEGSDKLRKLHEKRMQMIDNVSRTICDIQSFSGSFCYLTRPRVGLLH
jgi:hypothetical protein